MHWIYYTVTFINFSTVLYLSFLTVLDAKYCLHKLYCSVDIFTNMQYCVVLWRRLSCYYCKAYKHNNIFSEIILGMKSNKIYFFNIFLSDWFILLAYIFTAKWSFCMNRKKECMSLWFINILKLFFKFKFVDIPGTCMLTASTIW